MKRIDGQMPAPPLDPPKGYQDLVMACLLLLKKVQYFDLLDNILRQSVGVETCRWPGRHQVVYRDHVTYYLDGAHTVKSIEATSDWFKSAANAETTKLRYHSTLIKYIT